MTPQEALLAAAADIETNGHHKGDYFEHGDRANGAACALGALDRAVHGVGEAWSVRRPEYGTAISLLVQQTGRLIVADWNDDPQTSAEDVILAMKKAAHRG